MRDLVVARTARDPRRAGSLTRHLSPVLAALALLLALPLLAAGEPRKLDLAKLIDKQCGAPGYRPDSGCHVELGHGTFSLSETARFGDCTTTTVRNSVTLQGQSAGIMSTVPRFPTAGTTIQWAGPPGGVLLDACGASFLSLRDLTLDASGAGVGVRVSADNKASAPSHFVELRNVVIDGAEIGVHVTGRNYADQTDFVTLERVSLYNVVIGYLQDSSQSVMGRLETVEIAARQRGVVIRNGSLHCSGCYVGTLPALKQADAEFVAFHLTRGAEAAKPWEAHHQVHIQDSHMELMRGRFIVEDAGAAYPITLISNSYSLQCPTPGCEMPVVDSRSRAPLVMIGEVIQGLAQGAVGRICHRGPELVRLGVTKKPEVGLEWNCEPEKPPGDPPG